MKILAAAALLAIVLLVAFWDWSWLKPVAEWRLSAALNRAVTIGHMAVSPGAESQISLDTVAIAGTAASSAGARATIDRLTLRVALWPLLAGRLVLPAITIERLRGTIAPDPSDVDFGLGLPASKPGARDLEIGTLDIRDGELHFVYPQHLSDVGLLVHTQGQGADSQLFVSAAGVWSGQPFAAQLTGGAVLGLRDTVHPYPLEFTAENGATRLSLHGTLLDPLHLGGAALVLELHGEDLSQLYALTGIPLPPTPPYRIKGSLDWEKNTMRFTSFAGTVGSSDLAGQFLYEPRSTPDARPVVTATLSSKKLVLADLAGFIGAEPGRTTALPDAPINLAKLRLMDFHIAYKGAHVETQKTPIDNLAARLDVVDGKVTVHPLTFGVGSGQIAMNVALDGQQDQVHAVADATFRKLDLRRLMQGSKLFKGAGTIGGKGRIESRGNSMKAMLGHGDGELQLFMTGGDLSALLVDLAGIDFGNAALSLLGIPRRTELRCMVADLGLKDGQVDTRTLVVDTKEANIIGSGAINLTAETIDYQLRTEPKRRNLASLHTPILIKGPFTAPRVRPAARALLTRSGAAVAFGVLLTPLAALIPTLQFGLGDDNDCAALLKTVGAPPPSTAH